MHIPQGSLGNGWLLPEAEESWEGKALRDKSPSQKQMFCSRQAVCVRLVPALP